MTVRFQWVLPLLLLTTVAVAQENEPEARPEPAAPAEASPSRPAAPEAPAAAPAPAAPIVQMAPVNSQPTPPQPQPARVVPVQQQVQPRVDPAMAATQYLQGVKRANGDEGAVDYAAAARLFASAARSGHAEAKQ